MYLFFGILFVILLIFFCLNNWRRRKIVRKVRALCMEEKCELLNGLIEPFGYYYLPSQDIFSTHINAWQRKMGYCALYDKAAARFGMIFDCFPVYFDFQGRTWLIEFWKGQYGINTGAEIGVYYADRIISKKERKTTLFRCVDDADLLTLSLKLCRNTQTIAQINARHWWLTAFRMGCFSNPASLSMHATVNFRSSEMAAAFTKGLREAGYTTHEICFCCSSVSFDFERAHACFGFFDRLRRGIAQWKNRCLCRLYLWVTRPFQFSVDRILYLYYFLPFAFRRMLRFRKHRSYRRGGRTA